MIKVFVCVISLGILCTEIMAQAVPERTLKASRTTTPIIDGNPNEEAWMGAEETTGFVQFEPSEGKPSTELTSARVLYDDDYLYIAAWLYDEQPGRIVRKLARRDDEVEADAFTVMIDSYFDHKTAYVFGVNASGSLMDGIITNDGQSFGGGRRRGAVAVNKSWDAVWKAEVALQPWGWSAEFQIPYSMLRFSESTHQVWGINFRRHITRKAEVADWVMVPRTVSGFVSRFGTLTGITAIQPKRNIRILPYSLTKYQTSPDIQSRFPQHVKYDGGSDFKIGITNSITLDAAVNPDFGQVEADPAELNLSTYETFFPEKRQFFLEGVQIFDFNLGMEDGLLYTRRIGAQKPIIGAIKLSGRSSSGFSVGLLDAVTGRNWEAERNFAVVRLKQELNSSSYIGSMVTSFSEFSDPDQFIQRWAGGVDWDIRLDNNTYTLAGEAILSNRDFSSIRKTGYGGRLSFNKIAGITTFNSGIRFFSPDFNVNDVGRLRRSDYISANVGVGYRFNNNESFGPFRRAGSRGFHWSAWNFDRTYLGGSINFHLNAEFLNFWNGNVGFSVNNIGGYDDRETRGNGLYKPQASYGTRLEFSTDNRQKIVYRFEAEYGRDIRAKEEVGIEFGTSLKLGTGFQISASVDLGRTDNAEAWVRNVTFQDKGLGNWTMDGKGSIHTLKFVNMSQEASFRSALQKAYPQVSDGKYYISMFTDRDARQIDFTLRSDIIITRDLSFQLYAQTFFAKVHYDGYKLLLTPNTFHELKEYPIDEDFNRKNLNFNSVLRWEYRPGSVLYVVWSQFRSFSESTFGPPEFRGAFETFDIEPSNIFMIKLSYLILP